MPRPFERRSEIREKMPSSKESGEVGKLERLRNSHGFKGVMTREQRETQEHQARTNWQENEYKAKQEAAKERANQPWRPENGMQLTSAYQHRAQHGSGVLAGTPEQAKRYWDRLTHEERAQQENIDTFMKLRYADASTSQSVEASSQNDAGTSRPMREVVEVSSSDEKGESEKVNAHGESEKVNAHEEGKKVNAHAERLLKGAKDFLDYKNKHMTTEEIKHAYQYMNKKIRDEIKLKAQNRLKRLKVRYNVINNNKYLSEEDFDQIWETYKKNVKRGTQSSNRQINDSDLSDFSA